MKHKTWNFFSNSSNPWYSYNIVWIYNYNTRSFLFWCVFIFKMVVQIFFQLIHLATQWTVIHSRTFPFSKQHNRLCTFSMSLLVFTAIPLLSKGTSTKTTSVGTLICVSANVCVQCVTSSKTSSTVHATIWALIRVDNLQSNSTNYHSQLV